MSLFKISGNKLDNIRELPFKLEKEIQSLVEFNLTNIFKLQLIRSEFTVSNLRIDSLAFDPASSSFVIIEYKKDRNFSVIDQGMSYLSLMLNNKAEFILESNERCKTELKRDDIDWSQTRVIFIAPHFTNYQVEAINFKDLPIELWQIHKYSNDTILFEQIEPSSTSASIKTVSKTSDSVNVISQEVRNYTEEDHLEIADDNIKELYQRFKELVLSIGTDINMKAMKKYIAFTVDSNITDVCIQKRAIKIFLNLEQGTLDDPKNIARNVSKIGHWGNGDYEIQISDDSNLEYIISLVRQSYNHKNK